MAIFQNRIVQTVGALLALLVFSGDVLDDVWNVAGSTVACQAFHAFDHQKDGAPTSDTASHDDTTIVSSPLASLTPPLLNVFRYLDIDEAAPDGAPASIDHPPQLA